VWAGPLLLGGSEGQVCFGDCGGVPDDAAHVGVAVVGFDVADRVALGAKCGVVVVGVDVSGHGTVREMCHCDIPFLHQPDC